MKRMPREDQELHTDFSMKYLILITFYDLRFIKH
jgi:hypothetical protein